MLRFQKESTIVSYILKKNINVLLLSKIHNDHAIYLTTGESKKQKIITLSNLMKGLQDIQRLKPNRWSMAIFYSMLNVAVAMVNARIILLSTRKPPTQHQI